MPTSAQRYWLLRLRQVQFGRAGCTVLHDNGVEFLLCSGFDDGSSEGSISTLTTADHVSAVSAMIRANWSTMPNGSNYLYLTHAPDTNPSLATRERTTFIINDSQ